ncbi:MAG: SLC13/DASS family transporter [Calditrichaceae bacterium]|nr:SLC13/DASS family transporter [Calditrichaceae bacterium]RQV95818.1 MAG: SLC13/DASS family transporter [Calditrichota bacterium]
MSSEAFGVAAVAVWMAIWWITEAIPIPATALLPIALFPTLNIMSAGDACHPYADHIIFLFLGGFLIAIAMEKWNLHRRLALRTIWLIGIGPSRIILGFMLATAFLSMWISNTATAMMMIPIAMAIIRQTTDYLKSTNSEIDTEPTRFRFATALMLGIAYSASIGGVVTIIGTPPNTILVSFVERLYHQQISFAAWMAIGAPMAVIMLFITWIYLVKFAMVPRVKKLVGGEETVRSEIQQLGKMNRAQLSVMLVFIVVAVAWISRGFIISEGQLMHDSTIAIMGALLLFIIPADFKKREFLLDWDSARRVPWDVILLFGGGLSLAKGFSESCLASWIGQQIYGLEGTSLMMLVIAVISLTIFLTEITSNTATSAMLLPIVGSVAVGMAIHPFGLMIGAAMAASYAFMLPVATPPNAIIFGSGHVTIPQMARVGFVLNIIGIILITLTVIYLVPLVWDIDLYHLPEWIPAAR